MRYFTILLLFLFPFASAFSEPLNIGSTAPNWSLQTKENETIDYYQDSDKQVSAILFWSTSCPYCATLMPHLEIVYRNYRNKGLKFYAISIRENGKINPVEYFETGEYTYTLLLNGDKVAEQFSVKNMPGLYVIDKDKKIIYKRPGGVSDVLVKQNVDLAIKQAIAK